jgi:hypothetical protein
MTEVVVPITTPEAIVTVGLARLATGSAETQLTPNIKRVRRGKSVKCILEI